MCYSKFIATADYDIVHLDNLNYTSRKKSRPKSTIVAPMDPGGPKLTKVDPSGLKWTQVDSCGLCWIHVDIVDPSGPKWIQQTKIESQDTPNCSDRRIFGLHIYFIILMHWTYFFSKALFYGVFFLTPPPKSSKCQLVSKF